MEKLFRNIMLLAFGAMTFAACEDVPEPYDKPGTGVNVPTTESTEIEGAVGTGTLADPFNAAAALTYGNTLAAGETSPNYFYIKGKVSSVKEEFTTQYGNGTFYISEDGSATNQFYAFRVKYLGNQKYASSDPQIKVGDDVVICSKITNYGGTIETKQNEGFLYSLNGVNRGGEPTDAAEPVSESKGSGTLADPYNAAAAVKLAQETGENESAEVYIKGKVVSVSENYAAQFGNGTFVISDDGTTGTTTFTIFRALYLGNKKYTSGATLKQGDEVIVYGKVTNYRGNTPETVQGSAYLYSLNGVTEAASENPTPSTIEPTGTGTENDPYNVAKALQIVEQVGEAGTENDVYAKGIVTSVTEISTNYGNATFVISDDAEGTNKLTVYRAYGPGNEKITDANIVKKGDEVVICGKLVNFKGNTPEFTQGCYIVSVKDNGGSTDEGGNEGSGEVSGNSISVTTADLGYDNAADITTINLSDGTTLTFGAGDNKNGPKYYNSGSAIRMYPNNFFTVTASKKISQIELTCSANNAEGQVTSSAGTVSTNDMTITVSSVNNTTATITNAHTGTGATSQLRIASLKIIYSE
jgi:hypothetical protein